MKNCDEQYQALAQRIIGPEGRWLKHERTGVKRRTIFHAVLTYDLNQEFPVLTTKRVAWRTAVKEMQAYMDGVRNIEDFRARGLTTWDNTYDRWSLKDDSGDMGPIYGVKFIETLRMVLEMLARGHDNHNLYITAVSPRDEGRMCLPACMHTHRWQLERGVLHQVSFQRSADVTNGLPFNMVQSAWLLMWLCNKVGLQPGKIMHVIDNAHIYEPNITPLKEQLKREPRDIRPRFNIQTNEMVYYWHHPAIKYTNVG